MSQIDRTAARLPGDVADAGDPAFRRRLGLVDLIAYGLAYIAPIAPLSTIGFVWNESHGLLALVYLVAGGCMLFTALSYAVMTREITTAGSVYGFASAVFGSFAGFMAGWLLLLDYLLVPAVVYVLMAVALSQLFPTVDRSAWILILVGSTLAINWFGVKTTSRVNIVSVLAQTAAVVILLIAAVLALGRGQGTGGLGFMPFWQTGHFHFQAVFQATSICVMSFLGFDAISTLAEEAKDGSGRTIGRAIVASLLIATLLFVVMVWILGNLMSGMVIRDPAAAIYEMSAQRIAPWVAVLIAWVYAIVVGFTNALPMQVGVARMLYAMARDGALPAVLARVHSRYGTPWVAMLSASFVSCVVALLMRNKLDELTSIVNFGALVGFLTLHLVVIKHFMVIRRSRKFFLHLVSPIAGILVVGCIMSGMSQLAIIVGTSWLSVGLVLGLFLSRKGRALSRMEILS